MKNKEYIETGILEAYVLGITNAIETEEVERMLLIHPELRDEMNAIESALEIYAQEHKKLPDSTIKPFLLATIDYMERLKNGEPVSFPPVIEQKTRVVDFSQWLDRPDIALPQDFTDFHARIIGYTPQAITAIVWIKDMAPQEVHHDEHEKFLIIEGTCTITVDQTIHSLVPGDVFEIPLHKKHIVKVTSSYPCKVILQRIAA